MNASALPKRLTVIDLAKEDMKFSAGHFTIFSATDRERLHGHNFSVGARITCAVGDDGMAFDYGIYKKKLHGLCRAWNEYFILPTQSPYLEIRENGDRVEAVFDGVSIPFLRSDILLLPIANATLEEFSRLMLEALIVDPAEIEKYGVWALTVRVSSGPGQSAATSWSRLDEKANAFGE